MPGPETAANRSCAVPAGSSTATTRAPSSSRSRAATRSSSGCSSVSVASAFPTSFSDSSRCDQCVASRARVRVSSSSFRIVKPTMIATRDPEHDRPPGRGRVFRRTDHDERHDLDEQKADEPDDELPPSAREREPEDREDVEACEARRGAAVAQPQQGCEKEEAERDDELGRPGDAAPAEGERDQCRAESDGGRDLAVVPVRGGQRDEREGDGDAERGERNRVFGEACLRALAFALPHRSLTEITHRARDSGHPAAEKARRACRDGGPSPLLIGGQPWREAASSDVSEPEKFPHDSVAGATLRRSLGFRRLAGKGTNYYSRRGKIRVRSVPGPSARTRSGPVPREPDRVPSCSPWRLPTPDPRRFPRAATGRHRNESRCARAPLAVRPCSPRG